MKLSDQQSRRCSGSSQPHQSSRYCGEDRAVQSSLRIRRATKVDHLRVPTAIRLPTMDDSSKHSTAVANVSRDGLRHQLSSVRLTTVAVAIRFVNPSLSSNIDPSRMSMSSRELAITPMIAS